MSTDVEELLQAAGERTPAWSAAAEERAAGIARAIVESRARRRARRPRLIAAATLALCALAAGAGGLWLHGRSAPHRPRPLLLGPTVDWGDLGVRLDAPIGRNPFGRAGVHMRLHDVATLLGSPLLPRGERPTDVWLEMQLGTRTMLDFDRSRVRILEQDLAGCCTFDIRNTAELRREASEHPGLRVTRIAGYPALVSPPGTYWTGWRIQVAWDRQTEVIVLAPRRGHTEAGLIRLIESLHRPRRLL